MVIHHGAWTKLLLEILRPTFSVQGHEGDWSFSIQAVLWGCRSSSRTVCLSIQSIPLLYSLSLPLVMVLWLLMALLQTYPSTRNLPCPHYLETLVPFFVSFFQNGDFFLHSYELFSIHRINSFLSFYILSLLTLSYSLECMSCPA